MWSSESHCFDVKQSSGFPGQGRKSLWHETVTYLPEQQCGERWYPRSMDSLGDGRGWLKLLQIALMANTWRNQQLEQ